MLVRTISADFSARKNSVSMKGANPVKLLTHERRLPLPQGRLVHIKQDETKPLQGSVPRGKCDWNSDQPTCPYRPE